MIDDSALPLLRVIFSGALAANEFRGYLSEMDEQLASALARKQKVGVLLDARAVTRVDAEVRRLQAAWMKENFENLSFNTVGVAFALNSSLVRGVLTAILWLQTLPSDHQVFASPEEAELWLLDGLLAPHPS